MPKVINKLCLICQRNDCLEFIDVFSEKGIKLNICQIILKHFDIQLKKYNHQNVEVQQQYICSECWSITDSFHKLYTKAQEVSITLPNTKEINTEDNMIFVDNVKKEENQCADTNTTVTVECSKGNIYNIVKTEPTNENITPIKNTKRNCSYNAVETVFFEDAIIIEEEKRCSVNKLKSNRIKKKQSGKIKENKKQTYYSDTDEEDEDNGEYIDDLNEVIDGDDDTNNVGEEDDEIQTKSKRQQKYSKKLKIKTVLQKRKTKNPEDIEKENQQIRDFFKMTCEICEQNFCTFTDAQKHYHEKHNQTGYLVCCKKKFFRRGRISDHINRHLNPDAYKCSKCNKIYADKFALRNHMDNHAPIDKREYKCDICTSSFTKLFKLSQHMRITHCAPSDEILPCPECDKSFLNKSKLTSHIRTVHESTYSHICHICAKTFKTKQVLELHQRQHLIVATPKLQCKICGAWLKHEHSLRDHMSRHSDTTATCGICKKVKPNKKALGNHMRYVHSERTHQCTMCEKSFMKAIGLKEHMASHTGVDLYTCTYCPKTFKSGANMHSHRKKVHPIEWQSDRTKRQKNIIK